jgi:hypothetical protein
MSKRAQCPDQCGGYLTNRTSRAITTTYRQLVLACSNVECGATFGGELSITHRISPSANPHPELQLRTAPPRRRADNDNLGPQVIAARAPEVAPVAMNDGDELGEAVATAR